ncbi:MAG: tRNA modification GTPase TrmE, partial [Rickettsia endosymbiont of Ixodes persulcatus]|nr:tRNA modification GTPase TrmE [Rickettsia endosymbiont of Ixodes persulcatus]
MPIFANEMVSSLPGNTKHIIYKLGHTILSSVYNTVEGSFTNGYLVENIKCNWSGIFNHLTKVHNDLSAVTEQCTGIKIPIKSIVTYGNSTSVILEEGKHLLQNDTLVELKECTNTAGEAVLREYNAKMLVNNLRDTLNHLEITLNNAQEVGVKIFNLLNVPVKFTNDNLKIILEAFNVTLDDISPTEVGKNILD